MKKLLSLLIFVAGIATAASIEFNQFDSPQQEENYKALIAELRCPQCQNNNIADSNATIATDMRAKTLELLKQGKTKEEVVTYMVERYGNFVTYDPPLTPATLLLWLLPALLVFGGFLFIFMRRGKAVEKANNFAKNTRDQARLNQILNKENL